jgi:hypothetical protein
MIGVYRGIYQYNMSQRRHIQILLEFILSE